MRFVHFLLLLLCSFSLLGQTSLTGQVVDGDTADEPLPFASVVLLQNGTVIQGGTTDLNGNFFFAKIDPGLYALEVTYTGYATMRMDSIRLVNGKPHSLKIAMHAGVQLSEVVVTDYEVPLIEQDNTTQGRTVTSEEIRNLPTRNINAIAATAPGLVSADENSRRSRRKMARSERKADRSLNVRGSRSNATNYFVDGIRVQGNLIPETAVDPDPVAPRDQYNKIQENDFISVTKESISTLSTDVDRAAYANIRGLINAGDSVPTDAVRIEEMINYFPYQEPRPKGNDPVAASSELSVCPWNPEHHLLRVAVQARGMQKEDAPAANVVFLVDVSGSMDAPNKLPMVTKALQMLASNLRPQDRVAIVTYAGSSGLALPSTSGADQVKIREVLNNLSAGGSTAGGKGIELAYKVATENFIQGGNNRVILVTDGDFNVGISDQEQLVKLIEVKRESGVFLTVIGCGRGNYQDGKMQELADRGNGNHGYLDNYAEARKLLIDEFGGTVYTVAKDVKLQLEFDPRQVKSYRLIGYENRLLNTEDFDDDTKDAAELGAGHQVTVLYELELTKDQSGSLGELRMRYKQPDHDQSKKLIWSLADRSVDYERASNNLRWSAAVAEFGLLLRQSKYKAASTLADCRKRAEGALGPDPFGYRKEMVGLMDRVAKR